MSFNHLQVKWLENGIWWKIQKLKKLNFIHALLKSGLVVLGKSRLDGSSLWKWNSVWIIKAIMTEVVFRGTEAVKHFEKHQRFLRWFPNLSSETEMFGVREKKQGHRQKCRVWTDGSVCVTQSINEPFVRLTHSTSALKKDLLQGKLTIVLISDARVQKHLDQTHWLILSYL